MEHRLQSWLESIGLGRYVETLDRENVDAALLTELDDQELKELGFTLGHRKILKNAIAHRSEQKTADQRLAAQSDAGRRQLTVMFCDLVGSTALSFSLDPEELQEITAAYQHCCESVVERFQGNIARYMGDGVLVYFGYPKADEVDPERAVLAALRLSAAVPKLAVRSGIELQTRIGIATGRVVVGQLIGRGAAQEHEVVGETPNLAARLQGLAAPNSVLIAESTQQLAGPFFDFVEHEFTQVKGVEGKLKAFEVTAQLDIEDRFAARHPYLKQSSLAGRGGEAERLWQAWRSAADGSAKTVTVSGDAGIGKSRLIHALRDRLATEPCNITQFQGVPYTQHTMLHPVINQLQRASRITRADSTAAKLDKLEQTIEETGQNVADVGPLFAALLSVPVNGRYPPLNLGPDLQHERTMTALAERLLHPAHDRPLLLVFEDLHWMDAQTLEFIDRLTEDIDDKPVMLLLSYRPEFAPSFTSTAEAIDITWAGSSWHKQSRSLTTSFKGRRYPQPSLTTFCKRPTAFLFSQKSSPRAFSNQAYSRKPTIATS